VIDLRKLNDEARCATLATIAKAPINLEGAHDVRVLVTQDGKVFVSVDGCNMLCVQAESIEVLSRHKVR